MSRFEDFTPSEIDEIVISLEHRLDEARVGGNAYVFTDVVEALLEEGRPVDERLNAPGEPTI